MRIEPAVLFTVILGSVILSAAIEKESRSSEIELWEKFDTMIAECEKDLTRSKTCEIDYQVKVAE